MKIEEKIERKFGELIKEGEQLKLGKEGRVFNGAHMQACIGWLASAQNIAHLVVKNPGNPYRLSLDRLCNTNQGCCVPDTVGEVNAVGG